MKRIATTLIAGLLSLPLIAPASAAYPDRPIRMLVGFPAGGSADIVARMVTEVVNKQTGYEFVIENRTGAGGNLAFEGTAKATPDGYTLLFSTPGVAINPSLYRKVDFATSDFTPVTLVGEAPLMIMVRNELPVKSIQELVTASKKAPDAIRFASSGNGSSSHLAAEVFRTMSGAQYLHVPYRGGAAITDPDRKSGGHDGAAHRGKYAVHPGRKAARPRADGLFALRHCAGYSHGRRSRGQGL